ncbi:MAG: hypothetical protein CMM47_05245 [Rhodospirillaceae bacterium]|nr:hypothetical protein [Rhodospirillaceae bacterium]
MRVIRDQPPGAPSDIKPLILFETVVSPHRSLSSVGFLLLMGSLVGLSIAIGAGFMLVGAWPVIGFLGIDVALIYLVFHISYKSGRRSERIRLTCNSLEVLVLDESRPMCRTIIQPYWARVELKTLVGGRKRLLIRSHGRTLEVGAFLGADELDALAGSLSEAIRGVQNATS